MVLFDEFSNDARSSWRARLDQYPASEHMENLVTILLYRELDLYNLSVEKNHGHSNVDAHSRGSTMDS